MGADQLSKRDARYVLQGGVIDEKRKRNILLRNVLRSSLRVSFRGMIQRRQI